MELGLNNFNWHFGGWVTTFLVFTPTDWLLIAKWKGPQELSSWLQSMDTSMPFPCWQPDFTWIPTTVSGFSWDRCGELFPVFSSHPKSFQLLVFGMAGKVDEFKKLLTRVPQNKVEPLIL